LKLSEKEKVVNHPKQLLLMLQWSLQAAVQAGPAKMPPPEWYMQKYNLSFMRSQFSL
jgi:hypothetical protein